MELMPNWSEMFSWKVPKWCLDMFRYEKKQYSYVSWPWVIIVPLVFGKFLNASTHLYKRFCPSVGPWGCLWVRGSISGSVRGSGVVHILQKFIHSFIQDKNEAKKRRKKKMIKSKQWNLTISLKIKIVRLVFSIFE